MALRVWASSTANALRLSSSATTTPHFSPLSRCFSSGRLAGELRVLGLGREYLELFVKHSLPRPFLQHCSNPPIPILLLDGLKYASSHEWVKHEGSVATIGITDHAQDHLGEVVFVDLPDTGGSVTKATGFGAVESVKATSDVNSPISGEIVEVNTKLSETPGLINSSPYEDGWMIKVKPSNPSELESLMGAKEYTKFCEEEDAAH